MGEGKANRTNYFDSIMLIMTIKDQCQRVIRDSFIADKISFILSALPRETLVSIYNDIYSIMNK